MVIKNEGNAIRKKLLYHIAVNKAYEFTECDICDVKVARNCNYLFAVVGIVAACVGLQNKRKWIELRNIGMWIMWQFKSCNIFFCLKLGYHT